MLTCGRRCGEILLPRGARVLSSIVPPMLPTLRENSRADGAGSHRGQSPGRPPAAAPPPARAKPAKCKGRPVPQLEDVTAKTGIIFKHAADPAKKYIVESMSGAVIVFDYDRDAWPDIYFTNAPTLEMAIKGQKTPRRAVSQQSRWNVHRCYGQSPIDVIVLRNGWGGRDYDNDGWPDLFITCLSGNVLYHNNGDGTFTEVTAKAGVADGRWSTGAAFGDYDGY